VVRRADQRTVVESQQLTQPGALAHASALTEDVVQLIRQRRGAPLEPWLERAAQRTLGVLRRLAQGLRDD
jgi:siderophore synthetase component